MIEYKKLSDPEYFKDLLSDINKVSDINVLSNLLKSLSIKISNKEIDPVDANMLLSVIKTRSKTLTESHIQKRNSNGGRQMVLTPTAISNSRGNASLIFLVVNIAIVTAMYTMLIISHIAK